MVKPVEGHLPYKSRIHLPIADGQQSSFTINLVNGNGVVVDDLLHAMKGHEADLQNLWRNDSHSSVAGNSLVSSAEAAATRVDYSHVQKLIVVKGQNGKNAYIHNGELVYTSAENDHVTFLGLKEFLSSAKGNNVEFIIDRESPPAKIAFYGTINHNLPGSVATDWMGDTERDIYKLRPEWEGKGVFNPDTKTNVQHQGLDMTQFAKEAQNLFGADVVMMNFEPKRGGIALAELRMAMLASLLTGHKLIVRIEQPDMSDINVVRSRALAMADINYFKHRFGNHLNMDFYKGEKLPVDKLAEVAVKALDNQQHGKEKGVKKLPLHTPLIKRKKTVLSGSSSNARDMAVRLELKGQLEKIGKRIDVDTYADDYDGVAALKDLKESEEKMRKQMRIMRANRHAELREMEKATDNIVYAGTGSLSQFGQMTTALLFSALNGSDVYVLLGKDPRDDYDGGTYRSESARIYMNPDLQHGLEELMKLTESLEGVAPQLAKRIIVITNGLTKAISHVPEAAKGFGKFFQRRTNTPA